VTGKLGKSEEIYDERLVLVSSLISIPRATLPLRPAGELAPRKPKIA
jgi:hypothetical protein